MPGRPRLHKQGLRTVAIRCELSDEIDKIVDYFNAKEMTTPEGFRVTVGISDVVTFAVRKLAKELKVK